MDDKEFRFMHTVDRPTVEQLRREIERLDAAERLTAAPEEDEEEQCRWGDRSSSSGASCPSQ